MLYFTLLYVFILNKFLSNPKISQMKIISPILILIVLMFTSCSYDSSLNNQGIDLEAQNVDNIASKQKDKAFKVFRANNPIQLDGLENDWDDVPKRKLRQELDLGIPITSKFDLSSHFKILWDDNNLYVFVSVLDEELNDSGAELYQKDGVEFYFDGDNSKNVDPGLPISFPPTAYDDNDDFFRFLPNGSSALGAWGIINTTNFEFETKITDKGYNVEIKMPFSDLPELSAVAGSEFGFEFQVNDNDNDQRQNSLKWKTSLGDSYFDPSIFATAVLKDSVAE